MDNYTILDYLNCLIIVSLLFTLLIKPYYYRSMFLMSGCVHIVRYMRHYYGFPPTHRCATSHNHLSLKTGSNICLLADYDSNVLIDFPTFTDLFLLSIC